MVAPQGWCPSRSELSLCWKWQEYLSLLLTKKCDIILGCIKELSCHQSMHQPHIGPWNWESEGLDVLWKNQGIQWELSPLFPRFLTDKQLRYKYWHWDNVGHDNYFTFAMHWNIFTYFINDTCLVFFFFLLGKQNIVPFIIIPPSRLLKNLTCTPTNITTKVHLRFLASPNMWRESISC